MAALDNKGEILYWAGNTAIHIFSLSFIQRLTQGAFGLPFHCAVKTVEHLDGRGERSQSKAWKFETFVFDAIPLARKTCCMEVPREEEFSPVKNKDGEDSPATARRAMSDLYRGWLQGTGIRIPEENMVEISPLFAMDKEDLLRKVKGGNVSLKGNVYFG
jgi:UDP-N-acetylglucosamine/UDP-N-acetylgalactosamine diphosphorylase